MASLTHIVTHVARYGKSHSNLYYFLPVIFFWGMFDTIVSYISPIVLNSKGYSIFAIGCFFGTSSIWGAGLYYDLYSFGIFEFVGHTIEKGANVSSFGLISIIRSLSMTITPIILGFILIDKFNFQTMWLMYICIIIAGLVLVAHSMHYRPKVAGESELRTPKRRISLLEELNLWFKVEKSIYPVLILITFLNIIDAFFWTLGPLISANLKPIHPLGGLFLTAYIIPSLFIGPLAATISKRF